MHTNNLLNDLRPKVTNMESDLDVLLLIQKNNKILINNVFKPYNHYNNNNKHNNFT